MGIISNEAKLIWVIVGLILGLITLGSLFLGIIPVTFMFGILTLGYILIGPWILEYLNEK